MSMKNLLGKLGIGRAASSIDGGSGQHIPVGNPEDAFASVSEIFIRQAQSNQEEAVNPATKPVAKKRVMHPVVLVSRFKYPYAKTTKTLDDNGEPTREETGEIGWKTTPNREVAEEHANALYAYKMYI